MKIKLKTLFVVTVLAAVVICGVTTTYRTKAEALALRDVVNETLDEATGIKTGRTFKSSFSNDFLIYSSGNLNWVVGLAGASEPEIDISWQAHIVKTKTPTIVISHRDTPEERAFAEEFLRNVASENVDVSVVNLLAD